MGQKSEILTFALGQFVENQWHLQRVEISEYELSSYPEVSKALNESKRFNKWTEIK
jgi:hypothetical protein